MSKVKVTGHKKLENLLSCLFMGGSVGGSSTAVTHCKQPILLLGLIYCQRLRRLAAQQLDRLLHVRVGKNHDFYKKK